jgi:hypothetical protein
MKPQSQIEISAQVWEYQACGGRDPKSCGCNSTAIMVALREAAEKHAAHKEVDRQYQRRKRAASTDAPVKNTKESGNGTVVSDEKPKLNAIGKPLSPRFDPNYKMRHRVGSGSSPISPRPRNCNSERIRQSSHDSLTF